MFRKNSKKTDITKGRHVVLTIKTTGFKPEEGDCLTQIACVEMINGKLTKNDFSSYVKVTDQQKFKECKKLYRETKKLKSDDAEELIVELESAPEFKDVEKKLLAYLNEDANTKIIVHFKKYVLDFMRAQLSKEGLEAFSKFKMENMISKAADMSHQGEYHGGTYPKQVSNDREKHLPGRTFYKFEQICKEFDVSTRLRTGFDAEQDANMLARAEHNRLTMKAKLQAKDEAPNTPRPGM